MKTTKKNENKNADSVVHIARANGAMVESFRNRNGDLPEGLEMAAFMAVFHPNIKGKKLKALVG